jgi:hypothetical protein
VCGKGGEREAAALTLQGHYVSIPDIIEEQQDRITGCGPRAALEVRGYD